MKSQNFPPLSEKASELFSQLVDINWEIKEYQEKNRHSSDFFRGLMKLNDEYIRIQHELIDEMGEAHYNHFIAMGRKMFA